MSRRERGEASATDGCSEGSAGERERESQGVNSRRAPVRDEQEERGEVRRRWLEEGCRRRERER